VAISILHVQTTSATFPFDDGTTQQITATWTHGNFAVVYSFAFVSGGSPSLTSVVGSNSGTWSEGIVVPVVSNRQFIIYYKENIKGGSDTLTLTFGGALSSGSRVVASEYSGVALSGSKTASNSNTGGGSNTTITTGSITPGNANSLIVAVGHALADVTLTESHTFRSEAESFGTVGLQDTITTVAATLTWELGSAAFWHMAYVVFKPATEFYTRESKTSLPSNDDNLAIAYTASDKTDVDTDNSVRVPAEAINNDPFLIHEYKDVDVSDVATSVSITWNGQADLAPSSFVVNLQIYNRNTSSWETIDSDNTASADTDFDLIATVTPLTDYVDANKIISCRVYQNPTYSSSSSSSRSSSSSSSSSRSSSSSSSSCRSSSSSSSSQSPSCWVAAEIFGGWYAPKTVSARYYVVNMAPSWFRTFYEKHGQMIARFIHNKPIFKSLLRPLFEHFASLARKKLDGQT
jgi:hypothetical protein